MNVLDSFKEIWLADFEFRAPPGERPTPLCMVAREFRSGRTYRIWKDDLVELLGPPFSIRPDALFVAYYASAELGCFCSLRWPMPVRILDLFAEFRTRCNGLGTPCGASLLGALAYFGIDGIDSTEKEEMRQLAMREGKHTEVERYALLDYCESDVTALEALLPAMLPKIDLPRALLRGRYMAAAARMEFNGVPLDKDTLQNFRDNWDVIKSRLTREIDCNYHVFIPAGSAAIDSQSRLGSAIYQKSAEIGAHPYNLAIAVDDVYKRYLEREAPLVAIKNAARRETVLTTNRVETWVGSDKDHSTYPQLDTTTRDVAAGLAELCISGGHETDGSGDTAHAALPSDRLRQSTERLKPKHHPDFLCEAAAHFVGKHDTIPDCVPLGFSAARFADWLIQNSIPWPRLETGQLALDDDTFRQMARTYPAVAPLRELRHALGEMRLFEDLAVGTDGRNRCLLSAFRSLTGRNQPSNAKFIFGPSCWLRALIRPEAGRATAYVDWSQQEFGIAAALSDDAAMQQAYLSGDPYLSFAKQAGAVPADATKESHKSERELFKVCSLAVQYGMGSQSLARSLDKPEALARQLLALHRRTYPVFWRWSDGCINHAMLKGCLWTVFGWRVQVGPRANPRSLGNFPMQANGAEMLRLACCLATERGIVVCAPIHDALLVEGAADEIENVVGDTQAAMREASRVVLDGFELRTDVKVVRYPERYMDPRGERMWEAVQGILAALQQEPCHEAEARAF